MCDTKRLCPSVLASVYKDESVCVHVCLCGGGGHGEALGLLQGQLPAGWNG